MRQICVMSDDDAHFRLRIPRQLKEWVEESAKANNRSINAEILHCIDFVKNHSFQEHDELMRVFDRKIEEYMKPFHEEIEELKTKILRNNK